METPSGSSLWEIADLSELSDDRLVRVVYAAAKRHLHARGRLPEFRSPETIEAFEQLRQKDRAAPILVAWLVPIEAARILKRPLPAAARRPTEQKVDEAVCLLWLEEEREDVHRMLRARASRLLDDVAFLSLVEELALQERIAKEGVLGSGVWSMSNLTDLGRGPSYGPDAQDPAPASTTP